MGKKIGVTSKAVMNMLNVYQPDFGYLLTDMVYSEGEIAFILKRDYVALG